MLELDAERILNAEVEVGYLHRGFEKTCENKTWFNLLPYTDRLNYVSPLINNLGYAMTMEKMLGLAVPERAQLIRVLMSEMSRVSDHLTCLAAMAMECGAFTVFLYMMKAREFLWDAIEFTAGARMTTSYIRIGGVRADLHPGWRGRRRRGGEGDPQGPQGRLGPSRREQHLPGPDPGRRGHLAGGRPVLRLDRAVPPFDGHRLRRAQGRSLSRLRPARLRGPGRRPRRQLRPLQRPDARDGAEPAAPRTDLRPHPRRGAPPAGDRRSSRPRPSGGRGGSGSKAPSPSLPTSRARRRTVCAGLMSAGGVGVPPKEVDLYDDGGAHQPLPLLHGRQGHPAAQGRRLLLRRGRQRRGRVLHRLRRDGPALPPAPPGALLPHRRRARAARPRPARRRRHPDLRLDEHDRRGARPMSYAPSAAALERIERAIALYPRAWGGPAPGPPGDPGRDGLRPGRGGGLGGRKARPRSPIRVREVLSFYSHVPPRAGRPDRDPGLPEPELHPGRGRGHHRLPPGQARAWGPGPTRRRTGGSPWSPSSAWATATTRRASRSTASTAAG
ncbi:MAG: hypothetical protein M0C28_04480 [Candidatus Moduliflexus flocculans]|nr:hypothetical protein [Candidatus Moduliflexus flocculans]